MLVKKLITQRAKQILVEGKSYQQEIEIGPHSGPYIPVFIMGGLPFR